MKLKSRKSHFQTLPEGQAPRRLLPVLLKFAYYLLLLGVLFGLIYVVAVRYLYISGKGQVETEKRIIGSAYGGRIKTLARQAGDAFSVGDILAVIDTGIECPVVEPDMRPVRLAYDIRLKQSERDIYARQLKTLESSMADGILPRALEIGDAYTLRKNQDSERDMQRLQEKIDLLSAEIAAKQQEMAILKQTQATPAKRTRGCGLEKLEVPFAGRVAHVVHQPGEHAEKGAPLFIVTPEGSAVFVEAFFDKKHLRYLGAGKAMTIEFPDRTTSRGTVVDYLSSASYYAERDRKDYLPVEARLRVNLKPADPADAALWRRYDRMDVLVRGER
jgi:multidrug resistance efflux pump